MKTNSIRQLLSFSLLAGIALTLAATNAHAQYPRPTLSPYLDYFRNDNPILPQYHQFVRPKIELQQTLDRQTAQLQYQQRQLRTLDQGMSGMVSGEIRPTGVQAGYMNFSHYYQQPQSRRMR